MFFFSTTIQGLVVCLQGLIVVQMTGNRSHCATSLLLPSCTVLSNRGLLLLDTTYKTPAICWLINSNVSLQSILFISFYEFLSRFPPLYHQLFCHVVLHLLHLQLHSHFLMYTYGTGITTQLLYAQGNKIRQLKWNNFESLLHFLVIMQMLVYYIRL